jgi:hypothetical protein
VRPKYVLWILVAVASAVWYMVDPEAKFSISRLAVAGTEEGNQVIPGSVPHSKLAADPARSTSGMRLSSCAIVGRHTDALAVVCVASYTDGGMAPTDSGGPTTTGDLT